MNWLAEVRDKLARHALRAVEVPAGTRRAAVLAPLYVRDKELWLLFTRRTEKVETHKGEVSFPGGAFEDGDGTLQETAIRETVEELGLEKGQIVPLGSLSPVITHVSNFYVEPLVAAIPWPVKLDPSKEEIESVWEIPVAALMSPTAVEERQFPGSAHAILFYHYGPKVIWGATARILKELLEVLGEEFT